MEIIFAKQYLKDLHITGKQPKKSIGTNRISSEDTEKQLTALPSWKGSKA